VRPRVWRPVPKGPDDNKPRWQERAEELIEVEEALLAQRLNAVAQGGQALT
jgi:hypothetical protein